ncbi:MAG: iron complex outermembrane recepter protein [Candidatus Magnetoglobus multicellularis str. Araruama]|uniref:Iron complex outermembrane recepter protein n=1 Tax=Candidatus Magnetoglobus multicellularis str. Araruama TaxID=890399 RepID=A0A1V1P4Y3_9BACT|nr:MAG: iron complex outermembrane recepter protein [Candidatus Magnetoglobus multicellularis str. Araruama]
MRETPYKSYAKETNWFGIQMSNTFSFLSHDITYGFDYQTIDVSSLSFNKDGSRKAPYSPDNGRVNTGIYADGFLRFFDEYLIVNAGLRFDTFDLETKQTPLKTDFTPGSETFDIVNPRLGFKYFLDETRMFQFHSTIGTAFVPPESSEMAGYSERELSDGTIMIKKGNADLDPETSITIDFGFSVSKPSLGFFADITYFNTIVDDKIATHVISLTESSYNNAFEAKMNGVEWELSQDFGTLMAQDYSLELYLNGTFFIESEEQISENKWQDIYNVSPLKFNAGISYQDTVFFGKFNIRYMDERKDNDWYTSGYPEITYDDFTVCDLSFGANFQTYHKVKVNIENIFDEDYFEKPEYPLPGRSIYVDYSFQF